MSPVVIVLIALAGAALITGLVLAIVFLVMRRVRRRMEATIAERFEAAEIRRSHAFANFFGRSSLGAAQVRGNGALVLTGEVLWFEMAVPKREVSIPVAAITEVGVRRSHLGKRVGRDLLYVEATVEGGSEGFAWLVDDLAAWRRELDTLRRPASSA